MKKNYTKPLVLITLLLVLPFVLSAQLVLLDESFENGIPTEWTQQSVVGSGVWTSRTCDSFLFPSGDCPDGNASVFFQTNNPSSTVGRLISPQLNAAVMGESKLIFYYALPAFPDGTSDMLKVYSRTSPTGEWELLKEITFSSYSWRKETISIPSSSTSAQFQIAFEGVDQHGRGIMLDKVRLESEYVCPVPSGLRTVGVNHNSATLLWTGIDELVSYEVKIDTQEITDFDAPAWHDNIATENNYYIPNLEPNTTYYFYVRTNCDTYGKSEWSEKGSFTTACSTVETLHEGFESFAANLGQGGDKIGCWSSYLTASVPTLSITNAYYPYIQKGTTSSNTYTKYGTNAVRLYGYYSSSTGYTTSYFISPGISDNVDLSELQLRFHLYCTNVNWKLHIGVMDGPTDFASYTRISSVSVSKASTSTAKGEDIIVPLDEYTGTGKYLVFSVSGGDANATVTMYLDEVKIEPLFACENTKILEASAIPGVTSATIEWKPIKTERWHLKVATKQIDPSIDEVDGVVYNNDNITGDPRIQLPLNPNTIYYYYVRPVCGEDVGGIWSNEYSFKTLCGVQSIPYFEGFEAYPGATYNSSSPSEAAFPDCWYRYNNKSTTYKFPFVTSSTGAYLYEGARAMSFYSAAGSNEEMYAITPALDFQNYDELQIVFYGRKASASGTFSVGFMTNPEDVSTYEKIQEITTTSISAYEKIVIPLAGYQGNAKHIAFYCLGTYFYLDNFSVEEVPACAMPDVTIKVTERGTDYIEIEFEPDAGLPAYDVAYGAPGFNPNEPGQATIITVMENKALIPGLPSVTKYEFYVRGNCGEGTATPWQGPLFTQTKQTAATVPYYCEFEEEDGNDAASNWTFVNGNQGNKWIVGTQANENGEKALYISSDGEKHEYSSASTTVHAVRSVYLEEGKYDISYKWKANGQSPTADFMRAFLAPGDYLVLENDNNGITANTNTPAGWIDVAPGAGGLMLLESNWKIAKRTIDITESGEYQLLFHWRNNTVTQNQPPAAVDSISIKKNVTDCSIPVNLTVVERGETSVTIDFSAPNTNKWEVRVVPDDLPNITVDNIGNLALDQLTFHGTFTEKPIEIPSLTPAKTYAYFVKSVVDVEPEEEPECNTYVKGTFSTIGSINPPYFEGFEGYSTGAAGNFIPGWSKLGTGNCYPAGSYPKEGEQSFGILSTVGNWTVAITPRINVQDISKLRTAFYARFNSLTYMIIGVMENPSDFNTFVPVDTVRATVPNTQEYYKVELESYQGQGKYMAFYLPATPGGTVYMDNLIIEEIPACKEAVNLSVSDIVGSTATLSWETAAPESYLKVSTQPIYVFENNVADVYDLEVTGNSFNATDLKANRTYYFYVQPICSETERAVWSFAGEFKTQCRGMVSIPFRESFDDYGTGGLVLPDCWHLVSYNQSSTTITFPYIYATNSYSAPGNLYFTAKELIPNIIATPELNTADISKLVVKFYGRSGNLTHPLIIGVMSDVTDPDSFVEIKTITVEKTNTWFEFSVPLNAYEGNAKHLAFKVAGGAYSFQVDDLVIEEDKEVTCAQADRLRTTRVSSTTARLAWNNTGSFADYFNLKYSEDPIEDPYDNEAPGVTSVDSINDLFHSLSTLKSGTKYYFTVQAICAENDLSYWAPTAEFTTLCGAVSLPYTEDFENHGTPTPSTYSTVDRSVYPFCWRYDTQNIRMGTSISYIYPPYITADNAAGNPNSQSRFHLALEPYYSSTDEKYTIVNAVTPEIAVDYIRDCQITFNYSSASTNNGVFKVGVMSDYMDASTFVPIDVIYTLGNTEWKQHTTNFKEYAGRGKYIAFSSSGYDAGTSSAKIFIDDLTVSLIPDCALPVKIKVENVGLETAGFTWTAGNNNNNSWDYAVTDEPVDLFAEGANWQSVITKAKKTGTVTANSLTVTGLEAGTKYYLYLKTSCSDASYTKTPVEFTTYCNAVSDFPYTQTFNPNVELVSGYNSTYVPCWFRIKEPFLYGTSEPRIWSVSYLNEAGVSVKDTALLFNTSSLYREFAISPELDVDDISEVTVSLSARMSSTVSSTYRDARIVVGAMTNPADHTTFVAVDTVIIPTNTTYTDVKVSLSKYTGNGKHVAFATIQQSLTSGFYINSITLDTVSCITPINVKAIGNSPNSLTIAWEVLVGEKWEVAYGLAGIEPDEMPDKVQTEDTSCILPGLTANTRYAIYVRTLCGEGSASEWSKVYNTITNQVPASFPFICSFEEEGDAEGWTLLNSDHTNGWTVGNATSTEGTGKSLYVSNNNSDYYYDAKESRVSAYRIIEAPKGMLKLSYQWKSLGATGAFLRAVLVPLEAEIFEGTNNGLGNSYMTTSGSGGKLSDIHPEGWINLGPTSSSTSGPVTTYTYGMSGQQDFTTYVENTIVVPNDTAYKLLFYWQNSTTSGSQYRPAAIDSIRFEYSDYCSPVENPTASRITSSSVFLRWEGYSTSTWQIRISDRSTSTPETLTPAQCIIDSLLVLDYPVAAGQHDTVEVTLDGLEAGKVYYYYIKPGCNPDASSWLDTNTTGTENSFVTLCTDIYTALSEDFESSTSVPTNNCWSRYRGVAREIFDGTAELNRSYPTTLWGRNTSYSSVYEGNGGAALNFSRISAWDTNNWLITPVIKLEQETALTFDAAVCYYSSGVKIPSINGDEQFMVIISDDGGQTWKKENATIWNSTDGQYPFRNLLGLELKSYTIDLAKYLGKDIRIAFYGETSDRTYGTSISLILDNIEVKCAERHDFYGTAIQGYPYNGHGFSFTGSDLNFGGDTIFSRLGASSPAVCDSLVYLHLIVESPKYQYIDAVICNGGTYTENGFDEYRAGTHRRYYTTPAGNDSVVVLNLTVNPVYEIYENILACPSALPVEWRGNTYSGTGTYFHRMESTLGCDSTHILHLEVENPIRRSVEKTICINDTYEFDGRILTESGTYTATLRNSLGCDSIVTLALTVTDDIRTEKEVRICPNSSFTGYGWEGLTESGEYEYKGFSQFGCDSTFTLRLYVARQLYTYIDAVICEGNVYNEHGFDTSTPGIHEIKYQAVMGGCDSIVVLNLDVFPAIPATSDAVTVKETDLPFTYRDTKVFPVGTVSGTYPVMFVSVNGCDSIVNLTLTIEKVAGLYNTDIFKSELTVSPNPVKTGNKVDIRYEFTPQDFDGMKVEVFNSLGICVYIEHPDTDPVVLPGLNESGIYIIRVTTGSKKVLFGKLLVQ